LSSPTPTVDSCTHIVLHIYMLMPNRAKLSGGKTMMPRCARSEDFPVRDCCKSYGPSHLDVFTTCSCELNSSYIAQRIWMKLGTKQDDDA
jgi:hypothetical protein